MRRLIRPPLGRLLFLAMILTLAACDASGPETKKASIEPVTARNPQQVQQYEQRMSSLLNQIANQDKALSELRVHQDEALAKAVEANKALMEEFVALRREMSQALGYEAGAAPAATQTPVAPAQVQSPTAGETPQAQAAKTPVGTAAPTPDDEPSRFGKAVLRLILVIILLAAIWLIIQIFMGRWAEDEDDEDEEDEEEDEDFILKNNSDFEPPAEPGETPAPQEDDKKQGDEQDEDKKPF